MSDQTPRTEMVLILAIDEHQQPAVLQADGKRFVREDYYEAIRNEYHETLNRLSADLAARQQPLGEEFSRVLNANLPELYER